MPVGFPAVGRVDQASRREDRRRRQHPVGIVVDPASRPWSRIPPRAVSGHGSAGLVPWLAAWPRRGLAGGSGACPALGELPGGGRSRERLARGELASAGRTGRRSELARGRRGGLRHARRVVAGRHLPGRGRLLTLGVRAGLHRPALTGAARRTRSLPRRAGELPGRRVASRRVAGAARRPRALALALRSPGRGPGRPGQGNRRVPGQRNRHRKAWDRTPVHGPGRTWDPDRASPEAGRTGAGRTGAGRTAVPAAGRR